jgi:hypothetical protein
MGPKKQTEKDSVIIGQEDENGSFHNEMEHLKQKLLASEEQRNLLENRLRENVREGAVQRDELVLSYQQQLNSVTSDKEQQIRQLEEERDSFRGQINNGNFNHSLGTRPKYDIPLPRPTLFDGKNSWESFIQPFEAMKTACGWNENEQLFRLKNSLRGEASEFAFRQLSDETLSDYTRLKTALATRFQEQRSTSSYLAELENRKFNREKETLAEYVAAIKRLVIRGYATADMDTRETIGLRHFLRGLQDSQAALFIGMHNPKTTDQARELLDNYTSIKDDVKSVRVRNVDVSGKEPYVTETRLQEFGRDLKSSIGKKIDNLASQLNPKQGSDWKQRSTFTNRKKDVICYKCSGKGHYANECRSEESNRKQEN